MEWLVDKECLGCGVMMYGVYFNKCYCPECTRKKNNEWTRKSKRKAAQQKKETVELPVFEDIPQLNKDSVEAKAIGLSYGYWRLWKMGVYHIV